ncbi:MULTISPECIES: hypothetical protein [Methylobacterium]|jgi:hypothetical protein|uniref:Copper-binding protein n=1 Tax=Methylobacterium isbiliense TaxID=315478 RepID=A0ABQ4SKW0_9HYPH|nr:MULTISPECIES: hypothetical protein [Methylobacterium]MBY0298496.1 hypothetical protein [Methylobacterium sp.]MBY0298515.1 hypothetical protein [Methylobacterium sp.]MDN3622887.1 hypothetical protein [Methylobacterium isbiliense]GJE02390.1 hypothetical protein GMJLKIPL_4338 [Methylobacterium isbiliense]
MRPLLRAVLAAALLAAGPALARDLAKGRTDLPDLVLGDDQGNDYAVSTKDIEMEAGKSYRLRITAKGQKEYKFFAPEFFRGVWMNQIVINHLEIHMAGPPHHLEFDDPGTIEVEFVAVRAGEFPWTIQGLESRGMSGRFIVK